MSKLNGIENDVKALVDANEFLSFNQFNKIHCEVTNLDVPARLDALHKHLNSKIYLKHRDWYKQDFSKYEPHIIAHKKDPRKLYCTLSKKALNRIPEEIETHVNGKRFKRLLEEKEKLIASGKSRADLEGSLEADIEIVSSNPEFWIPETVASSEDDIHEDGMDSSSDHNQSSSKRVLKASSNVNAKSNKKLKKLNATETDSISTEESLKPKRVARGQSKISDDLWNAYKEKHLNASKRKQRKMQPTDKNDMICD